LTISEWNFRSLVSDKYASLLNQQRIYWKQRGTIKWVKLGDEWTKIFHANATIKHRRNLISSLKDPNGVLQSNFHIKAHIIWEAFKDRLGTSDSPTMLFNLEELLHRAEGLDCLSAPFSHEEIDAMVANLPSDKSPGPDGFNTDFVKRCWAIIKQDFYRVCVNFQTGTICLQSLNGSHITLLPKIDNPTKVGL
jgi:hypothetical protein